MCIQSVLEYATVTPQLVSTRFKTIIQHHLANCGIVFNTGSYSETIQYYSYNMKYPYIVQNVQGSKFVPISWLLLEPHMFSH